MCFFYPYNSMIKRYNQESRENDSNKSINDINAVGQHAAVPICLTSDVQLRFLCPEDLEEVRTLCQDWFPIDYPFSWYEDITSSTRFFALAAVYNLTIIGLIVAEIKPYARLNKEVNSFFFIQKSFVFFFYSKRKTIINIYFLIIHRIVIFYLNQWEKNAKLVTFYHLAFIKSIDEMVRYLQ